MDITQVAPKIGCATVVRKDFATNVALDTLLIALLEVLPNTRPLRPWDAGTAMAYVACTMRLSRGSWHMRALQLQPQNFK